MTRNFNGKDKELTDAIRDGEGKIFTEDLEMRERRQKNLLAHPQRKVLDLSIDAGGMHPRKVIQHTIDIQL